MRVIGFMALVTAASATTGLHAESMVGYDHGVVAADPAGCQSCNGGPQCTSVAGFPGKCAANFNGPGCCGNLWDNYCNEKKPCFSHSPRRLLGLPSLGLGGCCDNQLRTPCFTRSVPLPNPLHHLHCLGTKAAAEIDSVVSGVTAGAQCALGGCQAGCASGGCASGGCDAGCASDCGVCASGTALGTGVAPPTATPAPTPTEQPLYRHFEPQAPAEPAVMPGRSQEALPPPQPEAWKRAMQAYSAKSKPRSRQAKVAPQPGRFPF